MNCSSCTYPVVLVPGLYNLYYRDELVFTDGEEIVEDGWLRSE